MPAMLPNPASVGASSAVSGWMLNPEDGNGDEPTPAAAEDMPMLQSMRESRGARGAGRPGKRGPIGRKAPSGAKMSAWR